MATPTADSYSAAAGVVIYGGLPAPLAPAPAWSVAAGSVTAVGYTSGTHPLGYPATLYDIDPGAQIWNPEYGFGAGPWIGRGYYWGSYMAYSGAAWCETQELYVMWGTGHASICVPGITAFSAVKRSWSWICVPPPSDGLTKLANGVPPYAANIAAVYPAEQYNTEWGEWQGGWSGWPAALRQPGKIFPETTHSRTGLAWVPGYAAGNTNGVILFVINPAGQNQGSDGRADHYFDLDTNSFLRCANHRRDNNNRCGGVVWFGGSVNRSFALTAGTQGQSAPIDIWHPGTKTWSTPQPSLMSPGLDGDSAPMGAHLSSGLLMLFIAADAAGASPSYPGVKHVIFAQDAAAAAAGTATAWTALSVTATSWPLSYGNNIAKRGWGLCPVNGCFYAVNGVQGSTTLWKLSPPVGATTLAQYLNGTWSITTETLSAALDNGGQSADHVYNKLQWATARNCFLYVGDNVIARVQAIRPNGV